MDFAIGSSTEPQVDRHDFTHRQTTSIRMTFGVLGSVGFCGSLFVIVSYLIFPKLRSFNKTLVLFLATADLASAASDILSLGYFANPRNTRTLCTAQAMGIQYAEISSFLWSLIISIYLYISAVWNVAEKKSRAWLPLFLIVGFALPAVPIIVLEKLNAFGNSTNGTDITWCWIKGDFPLSRIFFYYGPMALIWLINAVLYLFIIRKAAVTKSAAFKTVVLRLSLYILAALLANAPALINRIQNNIDPKNPVFALFILHSIFNPLQGFCNAIVYFTSAPLRKSYKQLFKRNSCSYCCYKASKKEEYAEPTIDEEEEAYERYRQTISRPHTTEDSRSDTEGYPPLLSHMRSDIQYGNYDSQSIIDSTSIYGSNGSLSTDGNYEDFSSAPGSEYI